MSFLLKISTSDGSSDKNNSQRFPKPSLANVFKSKPVKVKIN